MLLFVLDLLQFISALLVQLDKPINVGSEASIGTVLLDGVYVFNNEFAIQHAFVNRIGCLRSDVSGFDSTQFVPEVSTAADSTMEIGEREFFIRAVSVVIVQSPAEQQCIDAELV